MSNETHYRSYRPDLGVRSNGDGRTVYGIAVPYSAPTRIDDGLVEEFMRGAFNHQVANPSRVKYAREHMLLGGELIGALTMMRDDAAGLYVEMRASRTPKGDETLELIRDGALSDLSIMFRDRQSKRVAGGVTQRLKADLIEVASVLEGAYGQLAMAAGVRSAGPMSPGQIDAGLRAEAEQYLTLPDLPDLDLQLRLIKLGLPF